jgi:LysM repeat protein
MKKHLSTILSKSLQKMRKGIPLVLGVVMLFSMFAPASQPALAASCTQYHRVRAGQTLYSIGLIYGVTWTKLAKINNLSNPRLIFTGQQLCVSTSGTVYTPPSGYVPTFSIVSVVRDSTVTIKTANFPPNDTFNVLMGKYGTQGVNGTKVGTFSSGNGNSKTVTFNIPAGLQGRSKIAIRLQSPTSGYFSYNWFYNYNASGKSSGSDGYYTGIPTFSISSVSPDNSVTIQTSNFPKNMKFDVLMGAFGTAGINGIKVTTIDSGSGGSFSATFNIPASLAGSHRIAIRLQSGSGYYAYNWFYNR